MSKEDSEASHRGLRVVAQLLFGFAVIGALIYLAYRPGAPSWVLPVVIVLLISGGYFLRPR